jgi:hypothetical protein
MKKNLRIKALFDKPLLVEDMVEKLACRRYDIGYGKQKMPRGWNADETSSTEAYVNGSVELKWDGKQIVMPFTTTFLFTCTHGNKEPYKLNWSVSLS